MIIYPPLDTVLRLHADLVGPDLVRDRGQVAATLARPAGGMVGEEFYPSIAAKAAALLHGFATTQAFVDGNKRMAVLVALTFLQMNGYYLKMSDNDLYHLTIDAAEGLLDVNKVGEQIAAHMFEEQLPELD